MARREDKEKAIRLRKKGLSYSQIKTRLGVSKSTLSAWLRELPLPKERLDELQRSEQVIEKIRATKLQKRHGRLKQVYNRVVQDIGNISQREFIVAGLFLYWAEGGKTNNYSISISNTDSNMIRAFIKWLNMLGMPNEKIGDVLINSVYQNRCIALIS